MSMRLLVAMAVLPVTAFGVTVEPLPISDYADTEASTNIPFAVSFDAMSRMNFSISLEVSPSNCVEVSIGEDANGDGVLSLDEADQTFGYNCGMWFQRDAAGNEEKVEVEGAIERSEIDEGLRGQRTDHTFVLRKRKLNLEWNLLKVTRRGVAEIGEVALVEGRKPGAALIVR